MTERTAKERTVRTIAFILTALFVIWWIDDQTAGFLRPDWIFPD